MEIQILSKKFKEVAYEGGNFNSYDFWAKAPTTEFTEAVKNQGVDQSILGEQVQFAMDKEKNKDENFITFNISSNEHDFDRVEKFDTLKADLKLILNKKGNRYNIYLSKVYGIEKSQFTAPRAEWVTDVKPEAVQANLPVSGDNPANDLPF